MKKKINNTEIKKTRYKEKKKKEILENINKANDKINC